MKILIVDDHRLVRDGLRAILEKQASLAHGPVTVVGDAANGHEAVSEAHRVQPDLVLMDIFMPGLNGIDATRRLLAELPHVKVLARSMSSDRRYVIAMFAAGAVGYLLKSSAADELLQAIEALAAGHKYVSPAVAGVVLESMVEGLGEPGAARSQTPPGVEVVKPLSAREREVLQLLAEGKSSKEMAQHLSVAVATVETHRRQIMDKLGLRSVAELTKYAIREGLTTLE